jgi:hypothetical protein
VQPFGFSGPQRSSAITANEKPSQNVLRRIIRSERNFPNPPALIKRSRRIEMNQLIYLVGLIVVILAILSFFGLR